MKTKQFVAQWGFCPHLIGELCADCLSNPSERSFYQSELLDLTHERQVAIFGWCYCEHNEGNDELYSDCPKDGNYHAMQWFIKHNNKGDN